MNITYEIKVETLEKARDVLVVLSNDGYDTDNVKKAISGQGGEIYLHLWDNKLVSFTSFPWLQDEVKQISYKAMTSPLYKVLQGE